jgi:hypothetical protein
MNKNNQNFLEGTHVSRFNKNYKTSKEKSFETKIEEIIIEPKNITCLSLSFFPNKLKICIKR